MRVGRKACSALQGTVRTSRRVDRHDHVVGVVSIVYFVEIAFDRKVGPRKEGRDVACRKGLLRAVVAGEWKVDRKVDRKADRKAELTCPRPRPCSREAERRNGSRLVTARLCKDHWVRSEATHKHCRIVLRKHAARQHRVRVGRAGRVIRTDSKLLTT